MKKKQKLLVLCFCAAFVLLTACQGGEAAPSVPESPSSESVAPSHQPQEEPTTTLPETLPEDNTELKIPLQVVAPGADVYQTGEWSYSTQAEVEVCRQWLYDLRAEDITALYGIEQPMDYYWTGEMSMEDSRWVIDLLRSMAPGLAPLESGNPNTGGSWTIALYTEDEAVDFGFDGAWFTFTHQGTIWIFDGSDLSVTESGYNIGGIISRYGSTGHGPTAETPVTDDVPTETYFDDNVQAIYAVDRDNYVMAQVKDGYASSKAIWDELQNRTPSDGEPSGYGYLIITDEGKEYVYMDIGEAALNKYCQAALIAGPLHPSWLIHMTPERMVEFRTYMTENGDPITDRDELLSLAKFLKEEVTVGSETTITDGFNNSDAVATAFHWRIIFDSGVEYTLIGYGGENYLSVYTSDLDKFVSYHLDEGVDWKFLEFEGRDWP